MFLTDDLKLNGIRFVHIDIFQFLVFWNFWNCVNFFAFQNINFFIIHYDICIYVKVLNAQNYLLSVCLSKKSALKVMTSVKNECY